MYGTGIVPDEWLIGIVKPIYKNKYEPTQPKNDRPITLFSYLGKLFTSILCNRLEFFSDDLSYIRISVRHHRYQFTSGQFSTSNLSFDIK